MKRLTTTFGPFSAQTHKRPCSPLCFLVFFLTLAPLLVAVPSWSAPKKPDIMVQQVTDDVLGVLRTEKARLKNNEQELYDLVDEKILPHFDFKYISQIVLGRYWNKATDQQKVDFSENFKGLLVRTYANGLISYTDEKVRVLPYRGETEARDASIRTEIIPASGPKVPVTYSMYGTRDGGWQIYDVNINGVSMVVTYRKNFASEIQRHGLDGLINKMKRNEIETDLPKPESK